VARPLDVASFRAALRRVGRAKQFVTLLDRRSFAMVGLACHVLLR